MIEVRDITFRYSRTGAEVFKRFSLRIEGGLVCGLLGKNGTGKSTLLYLLSGLLRPRRGRVFVDGMDVQARRPALLRELFLVPEEIDLPDASLDTFVRINEGFYPRFSHEVLRRSLVDFELPPNPKLRQLSMGQKKKVYLSFALATGTRLLFMDEPTNGLDISSKGQFRQAIVHSMTAGRTFLIATHQVHDIEPLLNHILILDHSQLLLDASVSEVCDRYSFESRQPSQMTADVLYAEPTLQGNAVVAPRQAGCPPTPLNLELLFNATVKGLLRM